MNDQKLGMNRFESLLTGASRANFDQVLYRGEGWVVAPTLGSIVPNWVLIIPEEHQLNFRDWMVGRGRSCDAILNEVAEHLGLSCNDYIWFEHGPSAVGTMAGCGLDHAHIHMIFQPAFDFSSVLNEATASSGLIWKKKSSSDAYQEIPASTSYMVAGCGDEVAIATDVEAAGSQFFRRVVCALAGENDWDYKAQPYAENIDETIRNFRRLSQGA